MYHLTVAEVLDILGLKSPWQVIRIHPSTKFEEGAMITVVRENEH